MSSGPTAQLDRGAIGDASSSTTAAALDGLEAPAPSARLAPSTSSGASSSAGCRAPPRVCVTEVPLLYEAGSESQFDKVVVVTAPRSSGSARSLAAVDEREQRLMDDREKVARADYAT